MKKSMLNFFDFVKCVGCAFILCFFSIFVGFVTSDNFLIFFLLYSIVFLGLKESQLQINLKSEAKRSGYVLDELLKENDSLRSALSSNNNNLNNVNSSSNFDKSDDIEILDKDI